MFAGYFLYFTIIVILSRRKITIILDLFYVYRNNIIMRTQEWIKASLKERNCKLKDVAEALGITPPRVTDIIKGKREVQADEIIPLAELLNLSPKSLLKSLEDGKRTVLADTAVATIPITGLLFGDGRLVANPANETVQEVPVPPGLSNGDGLHCFIMGDNSMAREIKQGDIIITADPRTHFYPMTPGGIFLIRRGKDKLALRQMVTAEGGETWLVPVPEHPNPAFESWRFSVLPQMLEATAARGTESSLSKTVYTDDIFAAVQWVHRRYMPPTGK